MGRMYSTIMDAISISTAKDLVRLTAPSDSVVIIHSVKVTQESTETSDSGAIQLQRSSTSGTGTSDTPEKLDLSDTAFGGTVVNNLTADTTVSAILYREGFNVLNGYHHEPTPEKRIIVPASGIFVVRSDVAITAATLTCEVIFEEIG